jgi:microcystin-dependent protein
MPQYIPVKNYADFTVLTKAQLDAMIDSAATFLNDTKLDEENIQAGGISEANLATGIVSTNKIAATSVTLSKLATEVTERHNPTGVVLPYAGSSAPNGYLLCDGTAVSRAAFAALFAVIGTRFGFGDNSTTFNTPDFRGRFLRGQDQGAGRDPDAAGRTAMNTGGVTGDNIGSVQADATDVNGLSFPHTHQLPVHSFDVQGGGGASSQRSASQPADGFINSLGASASIISSDTETRPHNAYVNYIIKT